MGMLQMSILYFSVNPFSYSDSHGVDIIAIFIEWISWYFDSEWLLLKV